MGFAWRTTTEVFNCFSILFIHSICFHYIYIYIYIYIYMCVCVCVCVCVPMYVCMCVCVCVCVNRIFDGVAEKYDLKNNALYAWWRFTLYGLYLKKKKIFLILEEKYRGCHSNVINNVDRSETLKSRKDVRSYAYVGYLRHEWNDLKMLLLWEVKCC